MMAGQAVANHRVDDAGRFNRPGTNAVCPRRHRGASQAAGRDRRGHHGVLGYSISNLDTGERLSLRGDETFPTASLIKVPILVTLYDQVEQKQLSLDDPLTVLKVDQVPGSGVLQFMHSGMSLSVRDAAVLMSVLSDNTATNLLLDRVAIRRVWQKMESPGLPHTKVHSKTFLRITSVAMDSSVKYGLGVSTPNEMAGLFGLLANGKAGHTCGRLAMLEILRSNADGESMQRTCRRSSGSPTRPERRIRCAQNARFFGFSHGSLPVASPSRIGTSAGLSTTRARLPLGKLGAAVVAAWPKASNP
jgi:beta-lactamase class A